MTTRASRRRLPAGSPGDITTDPATGQQVRCVAPGEWEPWEPAPYTIFPLDPHPAAPPPVDQPLSCEVEDGRRPAYAELDADEFAAVTAEAPADGRADGWTVARRRLFLERLSTTASVQEAARSVGMTRQSARKLYRRAPAFAPPGTRRSANRWRCWPRPPSTARSTAPSSRSTTRASWSALGRSTTTGC